MLTPAKIKALKALLTSKTLEEAAEESGLTTRTIGNYLNDPEFRMEYEKATEKIINDAAMDVKKGIAEAIQNLRNLLTEKCLEPKDRIGASRALLEYGLKLVEVADILKRIEKLESEESANVCGSKAPFVPARRIAT